MPRYQQALLTHIRECMPRVAPAYIDTVYFGGGTPSYYGARRLAKILGEIKSSGRLMRTAEITVEANPDSVTRAVYRQQKQPCFPPSRMLGRQKHEREKQGHILDPRGSGQRGLQALLDLQSIGEICCFDLITPMSGTR